MVSKSCQIISNRTWQTKPQSYSRAHELDKTVIIFVPRRLIYYCSLFSRTKIDGTYQTNDSHKVPRVSNGFWSNILLL